MLYQAPGKKTCIFPLPDWIFHQRTLLRLVLMCFGPWAGNATHLLWTKTWAEKVSSSRCVRNKLTQAHWISTLCWMHPSLCYILDSTDVGRTTIEIIRSMIPLHGSKELPKGYSAIWCPSLAPCRSQSQPRYPANMQSLAGHYASSFVDICSKQLKYWSTHPVHLSLSISLCVSLFYFSSREFLKKQKGILLTAATWVQGTKDSQRVG